MWCSNRIIIAWIFSVLFISSTHAEVIVDIDLNTQRYIGGESTLDREKYFNIHMTATENDVTAQELQTLVDDLNVGFGRGFWSPFSAYSGNAPYPNEAFARTEGPKNIAGTKNHRNFEYYSDRYIVTDHPRNVFSPGDDPRSMADWAANYFKYYFDETTRPEFYEPMNEPFVHAHEFGIDAQIARQQMTEIFKQIGKKFREENIPTKIIGYSSAWPSMELWDFGHFNERMKYFMDEAGPYIDSFSFHPYDGVNVTGANSQRSGSNLEAILDLMETYSYYKWQTVKPFAISEYGGIEEGYGDTYSDIKSVQSVRSINHMLFQLLNRQDRLLTSIPFITGKASWYYSADNNWEPYGGAILRPDKNSIQNGKPTRFFWTPRIHFYELWSDVKGERAKIVSDNIDVQTQAFVAGNKAYIALNNLANTEQEINLRFANAMGSVIQVRKKLLKIFPDSPPVYLDQQISAPTSLRLTPGETVVIEYTFDDVLSFSQSEEINTVYAREHLKQITANTPIHFLLPNVDVGSGQSIIKLGIARSHQKSKSAKVKINGANLTVPNNWLGGDQASRGEFFGALHIPVSNHLLESNNEVEVTFPDDGGRISSLVLEVHSSNNTAEDLVSFTEKITSLPSTDHYKIEVNYTASERRELVAELWKGADFLALGKTIVEMGTGTEDVSIHLNSAPMLGDEGYLLKIAIRPVNTDWTQNIDAASISDIHIQKPVDEISIAQFDNVLPPAARYSFDVEFAATQSRDVVIEFWQEQRWLANGRETVPAGNGETQVTVDLPQSLAPGSSGYLIKVYMVPVGADWRSILDSEEISNISIESPAPTPIPNPTPGPEPIIDQCDLTSQCKTIYGNAATDCANSRSNQSVCMCGNQRCDALAPPLLPTPPALPVDQCNLTAECKVIFGNGATDCANSRSDQSICMCGSSRCDMTTSR